MFNETQEPKYELSLGPLPWSNEHLRSAYFQDFQQTRQAIQHHPGYELHCNILDIKCSLEVFVDSTDELLASINCFWNRKKDKHLWPRPFRQEFESRERKIRRSIFASITSAFALVDNSRRVTNTVSIPYYRAEIEKLFLHNNQHRFLQNLRNYITHWRMVKSEWEIRFEDNREKTYFIIQQKELRSWKKWDTLSKQFIENHPNGVNIEALFTAYKHHVISFYDWFIPELEKAYEPQISEFRYYENLLNGFSAQSEWYILLDILVERKLDPYKYLNRFLNENEIIEVISLPNHSKQQADKIIQILDEYNACDEVLRLKVYSVFGVSDPISDN